jgi:hypothetical protein
LHKTYISTPLSIVCKAQFYPYLSTSGAHLTY